MNSISRIRLQSLMQREQKRFVDERPKSKALFERARKSLLGGVPMNWMAKWAGAFPPFVREAQGAHFYDVDGHRYLDLCLGDTGAMTGHSPDPMAEAVAAQVRRGVTFMLPTEDSIWVGEELQRRFGLPYWQIAMTATDANRFAIRLARGLTPDILTIGKPIAGGVPAAAYGVARDLADRAAAGIRVEDSDVSGIGGTLSGNALALAAMRATLERVLTPVFYETTIPLAERFAAGVEAVIRSAGLPWHVVRLGNRAEYQFRPTPPKNGSEAEAAMDLDLDRFLHLYCLNRGILMTP